MVARAAVTIPDGITVLTDGGYRSFSGVNLPPKDSSARLAVHKRIRARIEHILTRLKDWHLLR